MHPIRLFRAESFRVAAIFAALFLILTGVLIGTVVWIVDRTQRQALIGANEADIVTIVNGYQAEGVREAQEVVKQRLGDHESGARHGHSVSSDVYISIEDRNGVIAGNLPGIECQPGDFQVQGPRSAKDRHDARILGRCVTLDHNVKIFVGRDIRSLASTRAQILRAFAGVAIAACFIGVGCGLLLGRRFIKRVDTITSTCERIVSGRLSERIPLRDSADEWDRLASAINEMLDRIASLLENLKQVSSDIAHDLRTPLTRLRNRLEQAQSGSASAEHHAEAISNAIRDSDQLLTLFSALLRISQIESGTRAKTFAAVSLSDLLDRVYLMYMPVIEDAGQFVSRESADAVWVRGDQELLTQMFCNLFDNAIRHTPSGTHICLMMASQDKIAQVAVMDNGPGIPPGDRDKVLRRFYRVSTSRTTEGHGLGLSLVAAIAKLHGATLTLSDRAPGLCVTLAFDRIEPDQLPAGVGTGDNASSTSSHSAL